MEDDVQVIADDYDMVQVMNKGKCDIDRGKYLFYNLVKKIKLQENNQRELNGEKNKQEPKDSIEVPRIESKPTNLEMVLKRLVSSGIDQKTNNEDDGTSRGFRVTDPTVSKFILNPK